MSCAPSAPDQALVIETALNYLHAGFWPTPVKRNGDNKGAYLSAWSTKRVTEAKLVAELRRGNNLGIVLGPECGLVCIDVDNKPDRPGKKWVSDNEHRLGSPLIEHTGSGGYHLYYRYPSGKLAADLSGATADRKFAPGVEVMISRCQVVTWPSLHYSGNLYTLDSEVTDLRDIDQYDELPAWIVEIGRAHV